MNDTTDDVQQQHFIDSFYSHNSLNWFVPINATLGLLGLFFNLILLDIGIRNVKIRSFNGSIFLFTIAFADLLYGFIYGMLAPFIYFMAPINDRRIMIIMTKICGAATIIAVLTAIVFPPMLAINRYLNIRRVSPSTMPLISYQIRRFIASTRGTIIITIIYCLAIVILTFTLAFYDIFGEGLMGVYNLKYPISISLRIIATIIALMAIILHIIVFIFNHQLHIYVHEMNANCRNSTIALDRFKLTKISTINLSSPDSTIASIANEQDLKTIVDNNNRSSSMTGQNEKRNIRSTIAFIKYASLIPLCTQTPTFIAIAIQTSTSTTLLSIDMIRIFQLIFSTTPVLNAIMCLCILTPFRDELKRRFVICIYCVEKLCQCCCNKDDNINNSTNRSTNIIYAY